MQIEVLNLRKIDNRPTLKGLVDIRFGNELTVLNFKIFESSKTSGFFIEFPRTGFAKGEELSFRPILAVSHKLRVEIEDAVLSAWRESN